MKFLKSLLSNCVALMFVLTVATLSYGAMYTIDDTRVLPDDEITTTVFENVEIQRNEGGIFEVTETGYLRFTDNVKYTNIKVGGVLSEWTPKELYGGIVCNEGKIKYEQEVEYKNNECETYNEENQYIFAGTEYNIGIIQYDNKVRYENNKIKGVDDKSASQSSDMARIYVYNRNNSGTMIYDGDVTYTDNIAESQAIAGTITIESGYDSYINAYSTCLAEGGALENDGEIVYGNNVIYSNNIAKTYGVGGNVISKNNDFDGYINIFCEGADANGGAIVNFGIINYGDNVLYSNNIVQSVAVGGKSYDGNECNLATISAYTYTEVSGGAVCNTEGGQLEYGNNITYRDNKVQLTCIGGNVSNSNYGRADNGANLCGGAVENYYGSIDYNGKVSFENNKILLNITQFGIVKNCRSEDVAIYVRAKGGAIQNTALIDGDDMYGKIVFNDEVNFENNGIDVTAIGGKAIVTQNTEDVDLASEISSCGGAICTGSDGVLYASKEDFIKFNKKAIFKDNYIKSNITKGTVEYEGITKEEAQVYIDDRLTSVAVGGAISVGYLDISYSDDEEYEYSSISSIKFNDSAEFINNLVEGDNAYGGALANIGLYDIVDEYWDEVSQDWVEEYGIFNSTTTFNNGAKFINNKVVSKEDGQALGGAIYNRYSLLNLTANTNDVEFTGNTANGKSSAIYDEGGTINLQALNEGKIVFNDSIQSKDNTSTININVLEEGQEEPSAYGKVILNANMNEYTGTINIDNGTVMIDKEGTWFENASAVNVAKATVEMINDTIQTHNFKNVTLTNNLYLTVDVDLAKGEMDTINFTNFINNTGKEKPIEVTELNVLSDKEGTTSLTFTDTVAEQVFTNVTTVTSKDKGEYDVSYNEATGEFTFIQTKAPIKPQPEPQPQPQPVAIVDVVSSAIDTVQSNVMGEVFIDMNNKVDNLRQARNKGGVLYASTVNQVFEGENSISRGLWLRPFGMQEDIEVNGTKIETKSYGTLAGLDLVAGDKELVNVYIGVTGADQKKNELKVDQVNYLLGASAMYVEENWYVGLTANIGTNKSTVKEENKQDEFNTMVYTVGLKGGYNIDLSSKVSIEPNVTAWYGNTTSEEYNSEVSGTKVGQNTTNKVEVKPAVKVKLNLPKEWMPYATIGYAFNLSKDNEISVRPIDELGTNGYTEYGIGVNKTFNRFDVYLQGTGRLGGRDGYGATAGIKYAF